jgi:tetratricopeptide (TPR) repeat protein
MDRWRSDEPEQLDPTIEQGLMHCAEWSREGRHRRVLTEVEQMLGSAGHQPGLEAALLLWKAQALLAMGCADRALPAAMRSWELQASPHACHLIASSAHSLGDAEQAEEMLRLGWRLFSDATHLPLQLAMMLTEQGRLPEAIETLDDLPVDGGHLSPELDEFLYGLRANLLATVGRWDEAEAALEDGICDHPDSSFLLEAHDALNEAASRSRAEKRLLQSWGRTLEPLDGDLADVDNAIVRCGAILDRARIEVLAARRLWRAFARSSRTHPQAVEPWAAALLLAAAELDGRPMVISATARAIAVSAATVRRALARIRAYLETLAEEFVVRSFAVRRNPRLDEEPATSTRRSATIIEFPS